MKPIYTIPFLVLSTIFIGCATTGSNESATSEGALPVEESTDQVKTKTAYEGTTGSGLLMERYKAGQIQGFRD